MKTVTPTRWGVLSGACIAALLSIHCGSDGATSPIGNGGAYATGAVPGAGGAPPGSGGSQPGVGGSQPGSGGSLPGSGGSLPGSGGSLPGSGGAIPGTGGGSTGGSAPVGPVDPIGNDNRAPGFVDLSPPMGAPLDDVGTTLTPPAPAGWVYHDIDGAICRDGSPAGIYVHKGTVDKLNIFLEGGGACSNAHFCAFNPKSVNQVLAGDGQTVLGSALGAGAGRQQPGDYSDSSHTAAPLGIFETERAENPFKGWSQVYIPYCTGDVFFGTKRDAVVPGSTDKQQFVGYIDMQKFIGRIVPTFKPTVKQVIISGSSAGGFGALLNFSMVQDAFGNVPVSVLDDSGPPFEDAGMPVCMQKRWREAWGFEASLPSDCAECRRADGGGLLRYADFAIRKHPKAKLAIISSMQDEVIRLFYSVGLVDCKNYDTADPVVITLTQGDATVYYQPPNYEAGLNGLRTTYAATKRLSTYYMAGPNITNHQHLFRARFYEEAVTGMTPAKWVQGFVDGTVVDVGP